MVIDNKKLNFTSKDNRPIYPETISDYIITDINSQRKSLQSAINAGDFQQVVINGSQKHINDAISGGEFNNNCYENRIIDGFEQNWFESENQANPNGYGANTMSRNYFTGGATGNVTRQPVPAANRSDFYGARFFARSTINTAGNVSKGRRLEAVDSFLPGIHTFYLLMYSDAPGRRVVIDCEQNFGTGGSAPVIGIGRQTVNIDNVPRIYPVEINVPNCNGKVIGANDYFEIFVRFSDANIPDIAGQRGEFNVTLSTFKYGPISEHRKLGQFVFQQNAEFEKLRVDRHYRQSNPQETQITTQGMLIFSVMINFNAAVADNVTLEPEMRATPIIKLFSQLGTQNRWAFTLANQSLGERDIWTNNALNTPRYFLISSNTGTTATQIATMQGHYIADARL